MALDAPQGWTKTSYGVADDMGPVLKEIEAYCEGKFAVFYGMARGESSILWNRNAGGRDYKKFLDVAKKLEVKLIYINAAKVSGDDEVAAMGHKDEIEYISITFFFNQTRYVMYLDANWYMSPPQKTEEKPDYSKGYR